MEYTIKTINELCTKITDGSHFSPEHETDGLYPMYSVKDMEYNNFSNADCKMIGQAMFDKLSKADCRPLKNDILIAKDGSYLKCAFKVNEDLNACILSSIAILRPNLKKIDPDYFVYLMRTKSIKGAMANYVSGSALPRIILSDFKKMKLKMILSLPTQQKIASILSAYDNLIQNYKKQIEALQTAASELYKEWFVRFRFPGWKNAKFENGIPEGWKVEKLFDVAKIIYGYPFNSDEFCDDSTLNPVVRIRDILDNHTDTYTSESCDEKYWINPNEMLIGMDGIFHMTLWTGERALQNQRTVRVISKVRNLSNYYLYFSLYPQIKALEQMIVGTTVAHLGDKHLKKITILIPAEKILKMSYEKFEPMMNRIYSLQQQITNLTQQRDLLLPRLMSGKLEVK